MLSSIYHPHHKAHLKNWRMRNKALDFLWRSRKFLNWKRCLGFSTPCYRLWGRRKGGRRGGRRGENRGWIESNMLQKKKNFRKMSLFWSIWIQQKSYWAHPTFFPTWHCCYIFLDIAVFKSFEFKTFSQLLEMIKSNDRYFYFLNKNSINHYRIIF